MEITTEVTNVKLLNKESAEFKSGNVYLIKGQNSTGKTTFKNAIRSLLKGEGSRDLVSHGEEKGTISGMITGLDGRTYKVIINLKKDKLPSFTIIYPNLSRSNRKSDLAAIFQYEDVTAETFMGWGLTEVGRRKQADLFMKLMPSEIQNRILTIDAEINTKNGTAYIERREKGIEVKLLKEKSLAEPTEEQLIIKEKVNAWAINLEKIKEEYDQDVQTKAKTDLEHQQYANDKVNLEEKKITLSNQIAELQSQLETVNDTLEALVEPNSSSIDEQALLDKKEKIEESSKALFAAQEAEKYVRQYNESIKDIIVTEKTYDDLDKLINEKRALKTKLIQENLDINHIEIEDGMLLFKENEKLIPINEETLSYSTGALIVMDLVIKLNPNYPIVFIGKAAELDDNSLLRIEEFAKQTNSIVVLDKVDSSGEFKIQVYENE